MGITARNINKIIQNKKLTKYQLSKIIGCSESTLSEILNSKINLSEKMIEKLNPVLNISKEELQSWVLADNYSKEVLKLAIEAKQNPVIPVKLPQQKIKKRKPLILTTEIDKRIIQKGLSRTKLSELIGYNQGGLNRMILGKIPISETVILKISPILEISQNDILGWILADKYSLNILEQALHGV